MHKVPLVSDQDVKRHYPQKHSGVPERRHDEEQKSCLYAVVAPPREEHQSGGVRELTAGQDREL